MVHALFGSSTPIVAMVHLQYRGDLGHLLNEAARDVERLEHGGVDGLLFENWGEDYANRHASPQTHTYLLHVIKEIACRTRLPFGVNVLPLDYEADFAIAKTTGAGFVQLDTLVDRVRTDYANAFIIDILPQDVMNFRRRQHLSKVAVFANVQTKHYQTLPPNKKLETSARQALQYGADVLVVTGSSTGQTTPKRKLLTVKRVAGDIPIFIGSGLNATNADRLLPYADGAIVGSSLKYGGVTENPVDEERVKRLIDVVNRVRR